MASQRTVGVKRTKGNGKPERSWEANGHTALVVQGGIAGADAEGLRAVFQELAC